MLCIERFCWVHSDWLPLNYSHKMRNDCQQPRPHCVFFIKAAPKKDINHLCFRYCDATGTRTVLGISSSQLCTKGIMSSPWDCAGKPDHWWGKLWVSMVYILDTMASFRFIFVYTAKRICLSIYTLYFWLSACFDCMIWIDMIRILLT